MKIVPVITEKSLSDAKDGNYTFIFNPSMTKGQIKALIAKTFGVHVVAVRTVNYKHFIKKTYAGRKVKVAPYKKAVVTLKDKEKIDLFETKENKKQK